MHTWICTGNKCCLFKITKSRLSRIGTINGARGLMGYAYRSVIPRPHLRKERRFTPHSTYSRPIETHGCSPLVNNWDVINGDSALKDAHSASCTLLLSKK